MFHFYVQLFLYTQSYYEICSSTVLNVSVPNTVRRAEAESWSISDLTVQAYVPSSPSFTLGMVSDSSSFLSLGDKQSKGLVYYTSVIQVYTRDTLIHCILMWAPKQTHIQFYDQISLECMEDRSH